MKQHHILTTGISLLTNFASARNLPLEQAIRHHQLIAAYLHADPCTACAEINSLEQRTGFLAAPPATLAVTLVFTFTQMGKTAASLISKELKARGVAVHKLPVKGVDAPAADWTPEFAAKRCAEALSELRQHVTDHIARLRRHDPALPIQLNCTCGFKAECAVLYELGRTLRLPVYYLHETFRIAVELP
jgi:putative CRISPR-associated protein (TIGR02619 family)